MASTFYMTEQGLVQAPNEQSKNELLHLLNRLEIDMTKVANVTWDKSDTGFTLSVQYLQPFYWDGK